MGSALQRNCPNSSAINPLCSFPRNCVFSQPTRWAGRVVDHKPSQNSLGGKNRAGVPVPGADTKVDQIDCRYRSASPITGTRTFFVGRQDHPVALHQALRKLV